VGAGPETAGDGGGGDERGHVREVVGGENLDGAGSAHASTHVHLAGGGLLVAWFGAGAYTRPLFGST
jgi:hypothetical protein